MVFSGNPAAGTIWLNGVISYALTISHAGAHDEFSIRDSSKLLENIKQHFPSIDYDSLGYSCC